MIPVTLGASTKGPLRILCLGAHSDDIEIGCGGTLLRLLAEHPDSELHWVVFSSAHAERATEARASAADFTAAAAKAHVTVKEFRESFFPFQGAEIKSFFEEIKRSVAPDVVFTHRREDRHQDHRTVAELSWNTFRNHIVLEYEIPKYEGDLGQPNMFVPLTRETAQRKTQLIVQHFASQATRTWFRPETFLGLMSIRGVECNAPEGFAEAFHAPKLVL